MPCRGSCEVGKSKDRRPTKPARPPGRLTARWPWPRVADERRHPARGGVERQSGWQCTASGDRYKRDRVIVNSRCARTVVSGCCVQIVVRVVAVACAIKTNFCGGHMPMYKDYGVLSSGLSLADHGRRSSGATATSGSRANSRGATSSNRQRTRRRRRRKCSCSARSIAATSPEIKWGQRRFSTRRRASADTLEESRL